MAEPLSLSTSPAGPSTPSSAAFLAEDLERQETLEKLATLVPALPASPSELQVLQAVLDYIRELSDALRPASAAPPILSPVVVSDWLRRSPSLSPPPIVPQPL